MSNDPNVDPVGHAAKFLWILALLPVIFGAVGLAVPSETPRPWWGMASPFAFAAIVAGLGAGVYKRSALAARIGIGFFALAALAAIGGALVAAIGKGSASSLRALFIAGALVIWPIVKLKNALAVLEAR
jgi:hypothetical protein